MLIHLKMLISFFFMQLNALFCHFFYLFKNSKALKYTVYFLKFLPGGWQWCLKLWRHMEKVFRHTGGKIYSRLFSASLMSWNYQNSRVRCVTLSITIIHVILPPFITGIVKKKVIYSHDRCYWDIGLWDGVINSLAVISAKWMSGSFLPQLSSNFLLLLLTVNLFNAVAFNWLSSHKSYISF